MNGLIVPKVLTWSGPDSNLPARIPAAKYYTKSNYDENPDQGPDLCSGHP